MTFDDLSMMNFHRDGNGKWSYTAFRLPHQLWITNKSMTDPLDCIEEVMRELLAETAHERLLAGALAAKVVAPKKRLVRASGGMAGKSAVVARSEAPTQLSGSSLPALLLAQPLKRTKDQRQRPRK